jgi:RNA polymerase sigma-70 factor (ECF subfamily)
MSPSQPDEATFAEIVERHRRELRVHCYRMVGSFDDAEDMVQEAILRAWRRRTTFEGRSTFRAWLYRIATNVCLDHLGRHPRQPSARAGGGPPEVTWLQPFPDRLLDPAVPSEEEPDAAVVSKETVELAFLVALQHLPPRQRAVLVLRDVVGWPASDTATALEMSVASVKSALQRARATLRRHLPEARHEWQAPQATADEQALLQRFVEANERADLVALAEMVREDAWQTMPPDPIWFNGRAAMLAMWAAAMTGPEAMGEWRLLPTFANRQPAAANYVRAPGDTMYRASNLDVLRIEDGRIAEITTFSPELFAAFGLPETLPA